MLWHIHESLKPGGRLVIVEPSPSLSEETRAQQIAKHHIGSTFVAEEMTRPVSPLSERATSSRRFPTPAITL
jgi:hypothetical protein